MTVFLPRPCALLALALAALGCGKATVITLDTEVTDTASSPTPSFSDTSEAQPETPTPSGASSDPTGYLDVIDAGGTANGWALTPALAPGAISVAFYADGPVGTGQSLGSAVANLPRADVSRATGVAGDHGFAFALPGALKDGNAHQLFAYGLYEVALGKPPVLLGNSPLGFQLGGTPPQPGVHTKAQIMDTQGDLMIWGGPEFALDCTTGQDPETGVRCQGDNGAVPYGLKAGWVWSLEIPRYGPARREALYQKILGYGYTHVAIQVAKCAPGEGYHGLYPTTAESCAKNGALLNAVLGEIRAHGLITWCTGLTEKDPPEDGLDVSLCDATLDDWDNTDQKDCHIDAMAKWFPNAVHFVEMPEGVVQPKPDACTPAGLLPADTGGVWITAAQKRDPGFVGVVLEISEPNGHDANLALMQQMKGWWHDVAENRFEIDTYWKFWDAYPFEESKVYNDWFIANAPWLVGFMSGGTTHPPLGGAVEPKGGFQGELDLKQATLEHMAPDFADWPITTHITRVELRLTGVHVELDGGYPDAWPDTPERPDMGPLLYSMGVAEKIGDIWYASAPIQLWRGLEESGGAIQVQDVKDGTGHGQLQANWFYDPNRWGPMASYQPKTAELIGFFICAGDCRDGIGDYSPVHARSNVVLFELPNPNEEAVFQIEP